MSAGRLDVIVVGVRTDTAPFSYASPAKKDEELLGGYAGFVVEVCRRVLTEMVSSGPFRGYTVLPVNVTASDRFDRLDERNVDMLCGPDSITQDRLVNYNASHPLFLSGISFATTAIEKFPRSNYCKGIIGLVENTTAETEGLRILARRNALLLYDSAIEAYLALTAPSSPSDGTQPTIPVDFSSLEEKLQQLEDPTKFEAQKGPLGRNGIANPSSVRTSACRDGFESGPVLYYERHADGVEDLCAGKILFYVSDYDILKRRLLEAGCEHVMHRQTLTREAYGVYFRRDRGSVDARVVGPERLRDSALYAEFNNVLLRKMQSSENILDYVFRSEFKGEEQSDELRSFFDSFKFVSDF